MNSRRNRLRVTETVAMAVFAALSLALLGCNDDDDATATTTTTPVAATQVATSVPATPAAPGTPAAGTPAASPVAASEVHELARRITAPSGVTIALDGQMDDWADVPGLQVPLTAIPEEYREDPSAGDDVTVTLKVATDGTNIYVLMAVPDGYDFVLEEHHLSPAIAVQWMIDADASPHMGAAEPDFADPTGMVDIWHWEMDCGPGELSGGSFPTGNDPDCNLDDEYATLLDEREDDDIDNSLTGSWDHTARSQGMGADGTFVFEMARPLQTGDPQDVQFELGGSALLALAYWDGNEGRAKDGGWSDAGHVQSANEGWIEIALQR